MKQTIETCFITIDTHLPRVDCDVEVEYRVDYRMLGGRVDIIDVARSYIMTNMLTGQLRMTEFEPLDQKTRDTILFGHEPNRIAFMAAVEEEARRAAA